jgi:hypothetical protein
MIEKARVFLIVAISLTLASCGQSNREGVRDAALEVPAMADTAEPSANPTPVGGVGSAGCEATGCDQTCAEEVAGFGRTAPYSRRFDRSECVLFTYSRPLPLPPQDPGPLDVNVAIPVEEFQRPGCSCLSPTPNTPAIELKGRPGAPCILRGRLGECILDLSEIAACTPGAASSVCDAACELFETRLSQEFQRTYPATLRSSQCRPDKDCECIVQVGDQCYARSELRQVYLPWGWSAERACSLPASALAADAGRCANGCPAGRVCLFGRCSPPPPGPCTPGTCPAGQTCFQEIKTYCPDCPAAVCLPKAVCETLSPDCPVAP